MNIRKLKPQGIFWSAYYGGIQYSPDFGMLGTTFIPIIRQPSAMLQKMVFV